MYEELSKELREESEYADLVAYMHGIRPIGPEDATEKIARSWRKLFTKAADAIEELSRIELDFRQYVSDQVKREKGVYACCYCKNRESANVYEPGCIHEKCDGVSGWQYGTPKEET